jgi:hypothetical protein
VGDRAYSLVQPRGLPATLPLSIATLYLDDGSDQGLHVIYSHGYASRAEREATLATILGSLRPVGAEEARLLAPAFRATATP